MKKIIALSLLLLSAVAFVPSAEAKSNDVNSNLTANNYAVPQIRVQIGRGNRRNNRRFRTRVVTQTRNVRVGRQLYRETYRTTYFANGTTRTQLISRVRIGRY